MKKVELTVLDDVIYPKTKAVAVCHEHIDAEKALSDKNLTYSTITQSSPISRVGLGDDVDLSFCAQEGLYESASLNGHTRVNRINEPSKQEVVLPYAFNENRYVTIENTTVKGAIHNVTLKGQTLVNLFDGKKMAQEEYYTYEDLVVTNAIGTDGSAWNEKESLSNQIKPNTKYLVMCKHVSNNDNELALNISVSLGSFIVSEFINPKDELIRVIETPDAVDGLRIKATGNSNMKMMLNIIEYQEGMENWKIPYFEGIQSVNLEGIVSYEHSYRNHLVNPDISKEANKYPYSVIDGDWNILTWNIGDYRVVNKQTVFRYDSHGDDIFYVRLKIVKLLDTPYTGMILCGRIGGFDQPFIHQDIYNTWPVNEEVLFSTRVVNSVPNTDYREINLGFGYHRRDIEANFKVKDIVFVNLTKEYGKGNEPTKEWCDANIKFAKDNEVHYSQASIATLQDSVELHQVGSRADTIDLMTGKLTRKIYKLNLKDVTKHSNWIKYSDLDKNGTVAFYCNSSKFFETYASTPKSLLCNLFPVANGDTVATNDFECVGIGGNFFKIRIAISKLSEPTVNGLVEYLNQNDIIVYGYARDEGPFDVNFSFKNHNGGLINRLATYHGKTNLRPIVKDGSLLPVISGQNPKYRVNIMPSTKYSIVASPRPNGHERIPINFNLGGSTISMPFNDRVAIVTTPATLVDHYLTMSGCGNSLRNVMVIEGEVPSDIPFFEGMSSAQSPALVNISENLFDAYEYQKQFGNSVKVFADGTMESLGDIKGGNHNLSFASPMKVPLKPNTTYTFCLFNLESSGQAIRSEGCLSTELSELGMPSIPIGQVGYKVFTTNNQNHKDGVCFKVFTSNNTGAKGRYKVMIVEGNVNPTSYIPYLTNSTSTKHLNGDVVILRSLPNGTKDTLDLKTGELVQRIYEFKVTPEMIDKLTIYGNFISNFQAVFDGLPQRLTGTIHLPGKASLISDKLVTVGWSSKEIEDTMTIRQYNGGICRLHYGKDGLSLEGYKEWLREHQPVIQYEMATPIVTTVNVDNALLAYKNGHLQLSSLLTDYFVPPTATYQIQTTQSGVIQSSQDRLINHDKRLLKLENLLFNQLVQQEYKRNKFLLFSTVRTLNKGDVQMHHTKYDLMSEFIEKKLYRSLEEVYEMLDVYYMLGELTDGEYNSLCDMLLPTEKGMKV